MAHADGPPGRVAGHSRPRAAARIAGVGPPCAGAPTGKESKNAIKEGWLTKQGALRRGVRVQPAPHSLTQALPCPVRTPGDRGAEDRQLHPELAATVVPAEGRHPVLLQGADTGTVDRRRRTGQGRKWPQCLAQCQAWRGAHRAAADSCARHARAENTSRKCARPTFSCSRAQRFR